jgi:hypothetical protein
MVALIHGYIICGLLGGVFLFRSQAQLAWQRLNGSANVSHSSGRRYAIILLALFCAAMSAVYFAYVPPSCTGLYALAFSPENAPLAREISLKLLADPVPRYTLSLLTSSVVPLLTAAITMEILADRGSHIGRTIAYSVLMLLAWFLADLNGAKSILVDLALVMAAAFVWKRALKISIFTVPLLLGLALTPAYIITFIISNATVTDQGVDIQSCFERVRLILPEKEEQIVASFDPKVSIPQRRDDELKKRLDELSESAPSQREVLSSPPPEAEGTPKATQDRKPEKVEPKSLWAQVSAYLTTTRLYLGDAAEQASSYAKRAWFKAVIYTKQAYVIATFHAASMWNLIAAILFRALIVPMEVGGWYVHYLQTYGAIGVAAIPRLARILGIDSIDGPNLIGQTYGPMYYGHDVPSTIHANAGYVFSYFAYLGYAAIFLNLALLFLLDVSLWVLVRVRRGLFIPILAAMTIAALKFVQSEYFAVWLTHGFGVILILGLILTFALKKIQFLNRIRPPRMWLSRTEFRL